VIIFNISEFDLLKAKSLLHRDLLNFYCANSIETTRRNMSNIQASFKQNF